MVSFPFEATSTETERASVFASFCYKKSKNLTPKPLRICGHKGSKNLFHLISYKQTRVSDLRYVQKRVTTMNQVTPVNDLLPKFFSVYVPGLSGDDLEIPVSFNVCLPKPLPKHATLKSIYGKIWKVALRKCGGNVEKYVLLNGWKRIATDEDLAIGHLLEFEFDGSRCFNFCIYEPLTMCKRLRRSSVQGNGGETSADDEVVVLSDDEDDYNCADDNDAMVDDDDVEVVDAADDAGDEDYRQYLDDRNNPFFPVIIHPKRRSQLLIPSKVIKDYGLNFPAFITLVDPLVKKFGTMSKGIKIQLNGRAFIKGYGSVLRRNSVKLSDKIICELKKSGNKNLVHTIKFHIIK